MRQVNKTWKAARNDGMVIYCLIAQEEQQSLGRPVRNSTGAMDQAGLFFIFRHFQPNNVLPNRRDQRCREAQCRKALCSL